MRRRLKEWWGAGVFDADGRVDRSAVADIVFRRPDELRRLEDLLYPRLAKLRDAWIAQNESDPNVRAIVMDSPKLLEAGLARMCDAIVMIDADAATRLRRLKASRGWSMEDLARREAQQASLDEKRARADDVIINNSDLEPFMRAVEHVFERIVRAFHSGRPAKRPPE